MSAILEEKSVKEKASIEASIRYPANWILKSGDIDSVRQPHSCAEVTFEVFGEFKYLSARGENCAAPELQLLKKKLKYIVFKRVEKINKNHEVLNQDILTVTLLFNPRTDRADRTESIDNPLLTWLKVINYNEGIPNVLHRLENFTKSIIDRYQDCQGFNIQIGMLPKYWAKKMFLKFVELNLISEEEAHYLIEMSGVNLTPEENMYAARMQSYLETAWDAEDFPLQDAFHCALKLSELSICRNRTAKVFLEGPYENFSDNAIQPQFDENFRIIFDGEYQSFSDDSSALFELAKYLEEKDRIVESIAIYTYVPDDSLLCTEAVDRAGKLLEKNIIGLDEFVSEKVFCLLKLLFSGIVDKQKNTKSTFEVIEQPKLSAESDSINYNVILDQTGKIQNPLFQISKPQTKLKENGIKDFSILCITSDVDLKETADDNDFEESLFDHPNVSSIFSGILTVLTQLSLSLEPAMLDDDLKRDKETEFMPRMMTFSREAEDILSLRHVQEQAQEHEQVSTDSNAQNSEVQVSFAVRSNGDESYLVLDENNKIKLKIFV